MKTQTLTKLSRYLCLPLFALITACATDASLTRMERLQENEKLIAGFIGSNNIESKSSVTSFRYYGWNQIDDQYLILNDSPNRLYIIKLNSYCDGLRFANTIAVVQTGIGLSAKFDRIRHYSNGSYDCIIEKIYPINREQQRTLLTQLAKLEESRTKS